MEPVSPEQCRMCPADDLLLKIEKLERSIERIERGVLGDYKTPGILGRLDRIEQVEVRRRWMSLAVVTAIISLIVDRIRHYLGG